MKRVLLLNPPFDQLCIRDQFCSHLSKGTCYCQPVALVLLSGRLAEDGYELHVIDAVVERLDDAQTLQRVQAFAPQVVIFLTGCDSFDRDIAFVDQLKSNGVTTAIGIGDILREKGMELLADNPSMDACLFHYLIHGVDTLLKGDLDHATNMLVRDEDGVPFVADHKRSKMFPSPKPRYELFPLRRYRMPHTFSV